MNQLARFKVRHVGPVAVLDLEGDLAHDFEVPLQAAMQDPQAAAREVLLLNFRQVGYINSAGISVLVSFIAENRNRKLMACELSSHYQKIFKMVGLTSFLPIYATEQAALHAAGVH